MVEVYRYMVVLLLLINVFHVKCDDEDEGVTTAPNGTVPFPPPMTMDIFRAHVLRFLLQEVVNFQHPNTTGEKWSDARILVSETAPGVFNVTLTGDVTQENGEVLCRNVTRTYYSVDSGVAEFIGQDGSRYVFASQEPNRYVWVMRCEQWVPDSVYCPEEHVYTNLYQHDDDDIEYYEYDDDDVNKAVARRQKLEKAIAYEMTLSKNRIFRRNFKARQNDQKQGGCQYELK